MTTAAGRVDPADCAGVAAVSDRWSSLVHLLVGHAEHEDAFVQPVIERYRPEFAAVIAEDHPRLEAQMAALELLADRTVDAPAGDRVLFTHRLYLGLASFTAEYLRHQEFEETQVMPALSAEIGAAELRALDDTIVASLSPEEMMLSLPLMLAAMNVENRVELLERDPLLGSARGVRRGALDPRVGRLPRRLPGRRHPPRRRLNRHDDPPRPRRTTAPGPTTRPDPCDDCDAHAASHPAAPVGAPS